MVDGMKSLFLYSGNAAESVIFHVEWNGSMFWSQPGISGLQPSADWILAHGFSWFTICFSARLGFPICFLAYGLSCGDPDHSTVSLYLFRLRMCWLQCPSQS
jgi:hypothetical protein